MWAQWGSNPRPFDYESTHAERCAQQRKRSSRLSMAPTVICSSILGAGVAGAVDRPTIGVGGLAGVGHVAAPVAVKRWLGRGLTSRHAAHPLLKDGQ